MSMTPKLVIRAISLHQMLAGAEYDDFPALDGSP